MIKNMKFVVLVEADREKYFKCHVTCHNKYGMLYPVFSIIQTDKLHSGTTSPQCSFIIQYYSSFLSIGGKVTPNHT